MNVLHGSGYEIAVADAVDALRLLPSDSVHCLVTSVPYWSLRDYGVAGQIGLEAHPKLWVAELLKVFREAKRVLRRDGTMWVNVGDSYAQGGRGGVGKASGLEGGR